MDFCYTMAFNGDGSYLYVACNAEIHVFSRDLADNKILFSSGVDFSATSNNPARSLSFDPLFKHLYTCTFVDTSELLWYGSSWCVLCCAAVRVQRTGYIWVGGVGEGRAGLIG